MMFSCKKASKLLSASLDRELSGKERFMLRFHLMICGMCRKARRQLWFIQDLGKEDQPLDSIFYSTRLSKETRERIHREIQDELDRH